MIEYLFLDIEWNAKNNSKNISDWEPVQVAAIGADADLKAEKSFAKRVGLKDIETLTENTCKLTHVQRKEVAVAKPAKEVFGNLKQTFPKFSFVVVWSWETYQIYRETMKREEIQLPKHRVILMQEILQTIAVEEKNPIGFEAALRQAKVSYRPWMLHYSKYDVSYLYELFKSMYIKYDGRTRDDLCAVNPITRKIHQSDCRYAAGKNAVEMQGAKKFVFSGYKPCRCCFSKDQWRRFYWKKPSKEDRKQQKVKRLRLLPLTDNNIEKICEAFGFSCNFIADMVSITTAAGYWRIYLDDDNVRYVMHANFRVNRSIASKRGRIKCNQGFHNQNLKTHNFYDVVQYIYHHDKKMMRAKKKKIDVLFEKIEKELAEQ